MTEGEYKNLGLWEKEWHILMCKLKANLYVMFHLDCHYWEETKVMYGHDYLTETPTFIGVIRVENYKPVVVKRYFGIAEKLTNN